MPISDISPPQKKELKKEEKENDEEAVKKKHFFEGEPKEIKRKKIFIFVVVLFLVLSSAVFITWKMVVGEKKFKKNFYASECKGEWQNPANATGLPDVFPFGSIESFSETNSAVYNVGPKSLACHWFNELPRAGVNALKSPCGDNNENCELTSAKIYISFAMDNLDKIKKDDLSLNDIENNFEKTVVQANQGSLKVDESSKEENIQEKNEDIKEKEIEDDAEVEFDIDTRIIIWYSLDNGQTWEVLKEIETLPMSNYLNGGYISFDAPFIEDWQEVENLRLKFEGVVGGEEDIIAFLDSVWVEADTKVKIVPSKFYEKEIPEKIFTMFDEEEKISPESLEIITKEFEYEIPSDGRIIATVRSSDGKVNGIFRIKFLSEKNEIVTAFVINSGDFEKINGYDVPHIEREKIKQSLFLGSKEENKIAINVKKKWGLVKISIDYIPLSDTEKESNKEEKEKNTEESPSEEKEMLLDNLDLAFYPSEISIEDTQLIGEETFKIDKKSEKEISFENEKPSQVIIDIKETTETTGGGAFLIYLDDRGIGVLEGGYSEGRTKIFSDIFPGEHKIVIKNVDSVWEDNRGEREIKIYLQEKND